jgi:RNA polymerase sigma factor (sigma-70 family)
VVADLTSAGLEVLSASLRAEPESNDRGYATADHRDDLVRRLSRLPEQQRKIVVLRYYADQSEASVAEALGISIGTVKSAASRGLASLRRHAEAPAQAHGQTPNATSSEGSLR